jgi:Carboxypeptidase regulatory-like domain
MLRGKHTTTIEICLAICFTLCHGAWPAFSQGLTQVNGVIVDPTGAVIPGAKVTVTNTATSLTRTTLTNGTGWYSVTQLLPGAYTVRVEKEGFQAKVVGVPLPVNEVVTLDLALEIGEASAELDVIAAAPVLNTKNAQLGTGFDQRRILDLPLNARNIVGLLSLQTGVTLSDKAGEFARDDGGQVNGARNDQQNIVLDTITINQQERGAALEGAVPSTLDSVQEFLVETAGFDASSGRGSGAQVQLVTKGGGNQWHGSLYEYYRTTGTSARNYFAKEASPLIRHLPGGSVGGPLFKNRVFFFGAYEYNSDRSATLETRTIPTPQFLSGIVRYQRRDGSFGILTDGPGGGLETWTGIPGDRWNPALIGGNGIFEKYRPFSTDTSRTSLGPDNGANFLLYRFNAPFKRDRNVYVSRTDYNVDSRNSVFFRGTLNDDARTLQAETFPGFKNARKRIDNSKGFAANWNSVLTSSLNNNFSFGLTREAFEDTGNQAATYAAPVISNLNQTTAASRQAINTWNIVENLSWRRGEHTIEAGVNYRFIDNFLRAFDVVGLPTYSGAANITGNGIGGAASPGLLRALGASEFALVADPGIVGDATMAATGSLSRFMERVQFDLQGHRLTEGSPFVRNFGMHEWDNFLQDTWRLKPNLNVTYGVDYSLQTPPYERNGVQVNWVEDLGQRWLEMRNTVKTIDKFASFAVQVSGRANGKPDFYKMDTNNWAPRLSVAWSPGLENGIFGFLGRGGQIVVRGGYALTYDRIGGRFARDAATLGSIGLATTNTTVASSFSIDGLNGIPRAPRIGAGGSLPRDPFPFINQPDFRLPAVTAGAGSAATTGIDSGLHSPTDHLVDFTISKELPGGWVVESSYVGRFARDLVGQVDIASPPNVRDPISGMTWYQATDQLYTQYLEKSIPVAGVQPIAWFENVYPEIKGFVEGRLNRTFTSATQAWYAYLLQQTATGLSLAPGPNAPVSQFDRINELERGLQRNKLLNPQLQSFWLFGNFSRSNYHSGQFSARKRFGQGFTMTMNYTLSKSLDITSAAEAKGVRPNATTGEGLAADPLNPDRSYALSDFDRRHQFNTNFLVDLPFGTGKWLGRNARPLLNKIIGGWEVSGIAIATSGRPWNFTASNRFNHHYAGRDQPHVSEPIPFELTKQNGRVFIIPGTSADRTRIASEDFTNSHAGGSIARNQGHGPGFWNVDFSMTKNIELRENRRMRFRWEAFNLFNHPNFSIPTTESGYNIDRLGGTLGEITTTLGTERVMQFSCRVEF